MGKCPPATSIFPSAGLTRDCCLPKVVGAKARCAGVGETARSQSLRVAVPLSQRFPQPQRYKPRACLETGSVPIPHPWQGLHLGASSSPASLVLRAPRNACHISTPLSPPQLPSVVWPCSLAHHFQTGPSQLLRFARGLPTGWNALPLSPYLQTRTFWNILGKCYHLLSAILLDPL